MNQRPVTLEDAKKKLAECGQEHVLRYYDELSASDKEALLAQIAQTDFSICENAKHLGVADARGAFAPLSAMQLNEIAAHETEFRSTGLAAIKSGKVGCVLLAGGMGTRLGSDNPKGMYDIGLTKHVYIFQRLIENLQDVVREAAVTVPLFIMTSELNHDATVRFFREQEFFGYDASCVWFFKQEMAVACDYDGKAFLEEKGRIATSPNGNAGWFTSLLKAGYGPLLKEKGIEWLNIFAVDNVLQRMADPVFVGATISSGVECGAKVVKKAAPDEKVGVMCLEDGKPSIVEYYDLSEEMMDARDEAGDPAYNFGVILNYLFKVDALNRIAQNKLTLHVVEKKIKHIDEDGNPVKPEKPNGCKFEQLVLDMIHEMDSCLPFEVVREKEFAPIKNAVGVDSVESARELCKLNNIVL